MTRLTIILVIALGLLACEPSPQVIQLEQSDPSESIAEPAPVQPELILKAYTVPDGFQERLFGMLNSLVSMHRAPEQAVGRVQRGPSNSVVLLAPPGLHEGFAEILTDLESRDVAPPTTPAIEVEYWLVLARDADAVQKAGIPEISDALDAVVKSQGPMAFSLLERASLQSADGDHASSSGINAAFEQTVSSRNGTLHGDIEISTRRGQSIRTRIQLEEGKTIVLGQIGADPELATERGEELRAVEEQVRLFYVVRARTL